MADLSKISGEEQRLLVALPYRVGMWISNVDDVERRQADDKREKKVLQIAIERIAKSRNLPFAAKIAAQIIKSKSHWNSWGAMSDEKTVLDDVEKALTAVKKVGAKETKQYKQMLWQCALVVAQAFDESEDPDGEMHVNHFIEWMGGLFGEPKLRKAPENISPQEKKALKKLRDLIKGQAKEKEPQPEPEQPKEQEQS